MLILITIYCQSDVSASTDVPVLGSLESFKGPLVRALHKGRCHLAEKFGDLPRVAYLVRSGASAPPAIFL